MNSILIVKTSAIGDVIQTFAVLEYLRQKFPSSQIDWVVEQGIAPLLRAHPQINNVIEIDSKVWRKAPFARQTRQEFSAFVSQLRAVRYDLLFDLQGNSKSALVTCCAKADVKVGFGIKSVREKSNLLATTRRFNMAPGLNVRLKYLGLAQSYFEDSESFIPSGVHLTLSEEERGRLQQLGALIPGVTQELAARVRQSPGIEIGGGGDCIEFNTIPSPANSIAGAFTHPGSQFLSHSGYIKPGPTLMICFGSRWQNKQLPTATLLALLKKIAAKDNPFFVLIYGNEEEKQVATRLLEQCQGRGAVIGELTLPLWQALMWEVDGVLAVDSAALHLCGTTQTPSFSLFGPSLALAYKPLEERHVAVQGACPYHKRSFSSVCPVLRTCPTGACIGQLEAEELFAAYRRWRDLIQMPLERGAGLPG